MSRTISFSILKNINNRGYIQVSSISKSLNIPIPFIIKIINKLQREYYVKIEYHPKYGYRLQSPIIMLNQARIIAGIKFSSVIVECIDSIDSVYTYMQSMLVQKGKYYICIAEEQTNGKGRFDRFWYSPPTENLYFSLKTTLSSKLKDLSGLSIIISISIIEVLSEQYPNLDLKIKWPNDIVINNKKLAGTLIDIKYKSTNIICSYITIGIGINVNMQKSSKLKGEWTSLANELNKHVDRNQLAIGISNNLILTLKSIEKNNPKSPINNYYKYDYLKGKTVSLSISNKKIIRGVICGINKLGHLKLKVGHSEHTFASGDVSIIKDSEAQL